MGQKIVDFLIAQGPAILILVYTYMKAEAIRAETQLKMFQLQKDISDAHKKIDAQYAGISNGDVINKILGAENTKSPSDPVSKG